MNKKGKKTLPSLSQPVIRTITGGSLEKTVAGQINAQWKFPIFTNNPTDLPFAGDGAQ